MEQLTGNPVSRNLFFLPVNGMRIVSIGEDLRAPDLVSSAHALAQERHRTLVVGVDLAPLAVEAHVGLRQRLQLQAHDRVVVALAVAGRRTRVAVKLLFTRYQAWLICRRSGYSRLSLGSELEEIFNCKCFDMTDKYVSTS